MWYKSSIYIEILNHITIHVQMISRVIYIYIYINLNKIKLKGKIDNLYHFFAYKQISSKILMMEYQYKHCKPTRNMWLIMK